MKNQKQKKKWNDNPLPGINELMLSWNKSREQVLEMLELVCSKFINIKSPAMDRNVIKQAKKDFKLSINRI